MVAPAIRTQAADAAVESDAATDSLRIVREQVENGELLLALGNFYHRKVEPRRHPPDARDRDVQSGSGSRGRRAQ